jgi:hypothetical protein
MFQLTAEEARNLKFQFGISSWGGLRTRPPKQPRREIGFHVREKSARYRTRNGR